MNPEDVTLIALYRYIDYINRDLSETKNRINEIENNLAPEDEYFKTTTKVNKLIYYIFPVAFVFFALGQTLLTIFLYMYFGNDTVFNGYVKWIISSVGILGIAEIIWLFIYLPSTMKSLESKITNLEERN